MDITVTSRARAPLESYVESNDFPRFAGTAWNAARTASATALKVLVDMGDAAVKVSGR